MNGVLSSAAAITHASSTDLANSGVNHRLGALRAAETEHQPMLLLIGHESVTAELADDGQLCLSNEHIAAALLRRRRGEQGS